MGMFSFGSGGNSVGIDIGASAVKIVQLKKSKSGEIELVNYGMAPLPENAVVEGKVEAVDVVIEAVKDVIKSNKMKTDRVYASVSGKNVIIRFNKFPIQPDDELKNSVEFEAEGYVPFPMDQVSVTHAVLNTVDEDDESGGKYLVLMVVAEKTIVASYQEALAGAGAKPDAIDIDTIAALNALDNSIQQTADTQEGGEVVAVIDCGAGTTSISILKAGVLLFTRNTAVAGSDITRVIAEEANCSMEEAEEIKASERCAINVNEGDASEYGDLVANEIDASIIQEVRRSFDYFKAQSREPMVHKIIVTGGNSNIINFNEYLANELDIEVVQADPLDGIMVSAPDPDGLQDNIQQYVVAIGLALRGVES